VSDAPPRIEVFTDGACSGNPGPGGWAALLRHGSHEKWLSGAEANTTNNRMELIAAIRALQALKRRSSVRITTDSRYVQQGASEWLPGWKARGWRNAAREPVANQDLWKEMDAAMAEHDVEMQWVRGHIGHPENEACDQRAREAIALMLAGQK
jgi:ribonuclease HI